jgi:uncharacterized protein YqeY
MPEGENTEVAETIVVRLRKLWIAAMKDKSEDSRIYSFLRSKVLTEAGNRPEGEISDYLAGKTLAKVLANSTNLLQVMTASGAKTEGMSRLQSEIDIIKRVLPQPATDREVEVAIEEIVLGLKEEGTPLLLSYIMRVLAESFAGRYQAAEAIKKVQETLVKEF